MPHFIVRPTRTNQNNTLFQGQAQIGKRFFYEEEDGTAVDLNTIISYDPTLELSTDQFEWLVRSLVGDGVTIEQTGKFDRHLEKDEKAVNRDFFNTYGIQLPEVAGYTLDAIAVAANPYTPHRKPGNILVILKGNEAGPDSSNELVINLHMKYCRRNNQHIETDLRNIFNAATRTLHPDAAHQIFQLRANDDFRNREYTVTSGHREYDRYKALAQTAPLTQSHAAGQ